MPFYDLPRNQRQQLVERIRNDVFEFINGDARRNIRAYASDPDTYIRKNCYLALGRLHATKAELRAAVIKCLRSFLSDQDELVRQTAIYALGEIGKKEAELPLQLFESFLENWENRELVEEALKEILDTHRNYARFCAVAFEESEGYITQTLF